jgi:hypothetical protein
MSRQYCDVCHVDEHDRCARCGAAVVASLTVHRFMEAHTSAAHFCGVDNPGYQAMLRAMRNDYDESREMLTECPNCRDDVIRRANSPVLYEVHGYYGLLGDQAVHQCVPAPVAPPIARQPAPSSIERPRPELAEIAMEIPR